MRTMANHRPITAWIVLSLVLTGCAASGPSDGLSSPGIAENVLMMAAPYQNLDAVVFRPEDNCYWYWHDGPVERTLLPLRTPSGALICERARETSGA